ncbi:MAG: GNAT family N-acetyltransferase, partial [Myxococcota bacterium]
MALARATPQQSAALDVTTHGEWGGGLSVADHVTRERRLRGGWWPRTTHAGWLWTHGAEAVASCETYEVQVGGRRPGRAWAIASVFVPPEHRGRGHASALLEALAADRAAEPEARALVLFSDLTRPELYARLGFVARPAVDRIGPPDPDDPDDGRWTRFGEAELPLRLPPPPPDGFALAPSPAQLDWHLDQARTRAELTGGRRSARCG